MKRKQEWKFSKEIDNLLEGYSNKYCECGCGNKLQPTRKAVRDAKYKKSKLRFLKGHYSRTEEHHQHALKGKDHPMYGMVGELSPVWKGGGKKRTDYGFGWPTQRRHALKRDNYTCQKCGITRSERRIDVHHIIPFKKFNNYEEANNLNNLISYCYKCHMLEEWNLRIKDNGVNSGKVLLG